MRAAQSLVASLLLLPGLLLPSVPLVAACAADASVATTPDDAQEPAPPPAPLPPPAADPFAAWLAASQAPADGFVAPVGRAWTDCGPGCWETRSAAPVRSIATGLVVAVASGGFTTRHLWYEDDRRIEADFRWEGVEHSLQTGQVLAKGEVVGASARLQMHSGLAPEGLRAWLPARGWLPVPQQEPVLALISHARHEMRLYSHGLEQSRHQVGFGQAEGDKERRGDNRSPKGMYFVVARSTGPFDGPWADYYGGHWTKLNYPNAWDAARGVEAGLIDLAQQQAITRAWRRRALTAQDTRLGGGIGLHGWAEEWPDRGTRGLSWGCIVLHLSEVAQVYAALPEGAMVVLF